MFDWFYEFLYGISKSLYQVIDAMLYSAKKLCGIEDIYIDGEGTDFLTYLIRSNRIQFAFSVAAITASMLVVIFAIFSVLRTIAKEKGDPPMKILITAGKNILTFLFVPALMLIGMALLNAFARALYAATLGDPIASFGGYLFTTFAEAGNAWFEGADREAFITSVDGVLIANYSSTFDVENYIEISDYSFILSWISSILVMLPIGTMLLMFVDRAISVAILYIAAPFSIASSMVDEGARFKLWRDQVLVKFITGYGAIVALNVYSICMSLVMSPSLVFFPESETQYLPFFSNSFLDYLVKLVFVIGGAFSMQKIMALVDNLVSSGAGSSELRDTSLSGAGMGRLLSGAAGKVVGAAGKVAGGVLSGLGSITGVSGMFSRLGEGIAGKWKEGSNYMSNKILGATSLGRSVKDYTDRLRDENAPLTKKSLSEVLSNFKNGDGDKKEDSQKNDLADKGKGTNLLANSVNESVKNEKK